MQTAFDPQTIAQEMKALEDWISLTIRLSKISTIEPSREDFFASLGFVDMLLRTWQERIG